MRGFQTLILSVLKLAIYMLSVIYISELKTMVYGEFYVMRRLLAP